MKYRKEYHVVVKMGREDYGGQRDDSILWNQNGFYIGKA